MHDTFLKTAAILFPVVLLVGCIDSPHQFGTPLSTRLQGSRPSFSMDGAGPPQEAVREALIRAGLKENSAGDFRVEVGFSARPRNLSLYTRDAASSSEMISPGTRRSLGFCKKQAYVLTLAFIDSRSGQVVSRSGATQGRCSRDLARIMPQLVEAALDMEGFGQVTGGK